MQCTWLPVRRIKLFTPQNQIRIVLVVPVKFDHNNSREEAQQQDFAFRAQIRLEAAINRSQNYLLSVQKPEG